MKMKVHGFIRARTIKALQDYKMISEGDRIALGVSGGKDSLILLYVLRYLQKSLTVNFEIMAVTVNLGWEVDYRPVAEFCQKIGVAYEQVDTRIGPVIFESRKEKNPCSLCSRMRRGALDNRAKELECNKVALGHHLDDAIETMFLSMFYEGRTRTFLPVTYLDRKDLTLIRPLIYVPEKNISLMSREINSLPLIENPCPASGETKRQVVKEIVNDIESRIPRVRHRLWLSLQRMQKDRLWPEPEPEGGPDLYSPGGTGVETDSRPVEDIDSPPLEDTDPHPVEDTDPYPVEDTDPYLLEDIDVSTRVDTDTHPGRDPDSGSSDSSDPS